MHEGNPAACRPHARHLVYQAIPCGPAGLECRVQIGHPIADVVNAGAALGQELPYRTIWASRHEQLHLGFAKGKGQNSRPIDFFRRMGDQSQDVPVEGERRFQIGDGYPDMGDVGAISHGCLRIGWASVRAVMPGRPTLYHRRIINMGGTNTLTVHVSDASFAMEIEQANGLVLVDFWASWCGPCQIVAPILDQLAGEYIGKAKVAKVDVDANQRTAMRFNVRSIPSILFFKNGQHVDTVIGAVPKATLEGKIKQHLP